MVEVTLPSLGIARSRGDPGSVRALLWRSCDSSVVRATQSRQSKGAVSCRSSESERATRQELARPRQARSPFANGVGFRIPRPPVSVFREPVVGIAIEASARLVQRMRSRDDRSPARAARRVGSVSYRNTGSGRILDRCAGAPSGRPFSRTLHIRASSPVSPW